ncbi:unnamed protein product [Victoria cruziana]
MGNCLWRAFSGPARSDAVRVVTSAGGIMELQGSVTAERITNEFPGHGIFRRRRSSHPLLHNEPLLAGHLYYLLPLDHRVGCSSPTDEDDDAASSPLNAINSALTPYRLSFDSHVFGRWRRPAGAEGLPLCQKTTPAMWKVRLVISPEQLSRILAEESHTQVLIESVRTVAKCSTGCPPTASNSDESSSTGCRKACDHDI